MNKDTPVVVASATKEVVTPSVVDITVEKERRSSLEDTTVWRSLRSFPPLSMPVTNTAGNAPGKSSYANITGIPSGKKVNVHTLFTPGGNVINLVVPVDSIRAISERFANTTYGFFLGKKVAYPVVANYFVRNNPLILKKWHPDENLLKEDVSTVPIWVKLHGVPVTAFNEDGLSAIATKLGTPLMLNSYTSNMCLQSWGRSSYTRVMIEHRADVELKDNIVVIGHIHEECPKNTCVGEKKIVKKPSQTFRGVSIGPKMGFKPQNEYRHVYKKSTASSSGNKKKCVQPTIEATSSGSSFMHIDNDGEFASNTPIGEKINKRERKIGEGKLRLLDNDGNPLVPTGVVESDSEVKVVFDDTSNLRISTSGKDESHKGYGTNSLLEQWRDSYPDNNDYDPYDDDM
nr:hypothetical protein [Tanacetum cinerariifolium]